MQPITLPETPLRPDDLVDDGHCFVCGTRNAAGLHVRFEPAGEDAVRGTAVLDARFQGWRGVVHGGVVATLLDEAMAHVGIRMGYDGMIADLHVRYRKPTPVGAPIVVSAVSRWRRRGVIGLEGCVTDERGTPLATAEGRLVIRRPHVSPSAAPCCAGAEHDHE